jgi:hypothetical protein
MLDSFHLSSREGFNGAYCLGFLSPLILTRLLNLDQLCYYLKEFDLAETKLASCHISSC